MTSATIAQFPHLERQHRCVGTYETRFAAQLAVEQLTDHGFAAEAINVVARDTRPVEGWLQGIQLQPHRRRPVTAALAVTALVLASTLIVLPAVGLGVAFALLAGGIAAVVTRSLDRWLVARTRERARAARLVEADRFDVICDVDGERAAHVLARWWNPAALPVTRSHELLPSRGAVVERDRWVPAA